jgi:hypothetical protein
MCYRCQREVRSPVDARCPDCSFLLVIECEGSTPGLWREEVAMAKHALRQEAPPLPGVDPMLRQAMIRAQARRKRVEETKADCPVGATPKQRRPITARLAVVLAKVFRNGF